MAKTKVHPRKAKRCVFCEYWTGDANLKFISSVVGYEYESGAYGKCTKKNTMQPTHTTCAKYEPNMAARKLL